MQSLSGRAGRRPGPAGHRNDHGVARAIRPPLGGARRVFVAERRCSRRLERYFPELHHAGRGRTPRRCPHWRAWRRRWRPARAVRVAVIGTIGAGKGVRATPGLCARTARRRRLPLEFHVIGSTDRDAVLARLGNVRITGRYREHEVFTAAGGRALSSRRFCRRRAPNPSCTRCRSRWRPGCLSSALTSAPRPSGCEPGAGAKSCPERADPGRSTTHSWPPRGRWLERPAAPPAAAAGRLSRNLDVLLRLHPDELSRFHQSRPARRRDQRPNHPAVAQEERPCTSSLASRPITCPRPRRWPTRSSGFTPRRRFTSCSRDQHAGLPAVTTAAFDTIIKIDELPIENLPSWIFKHRLVELCTAVKGTGLSVHRRSLRRRAHLLFRSGHRRARPARRSRAKPRPAQRALDAAHGRSRNRPAGDPR